MIDNDVYAVNLQNKCSIFYLDLHIIAQAERRSAAIILCDENNNNNFNNLHELQKNGHQVLGHGTKVVIM